MAGMNGKDIGEMSCNTCLEPILPGEEWIRCAFCHKAKVVYRNLHKTCVDNHRKEHLCKE